MSRVPEQFTTGHGVFFYRILSIRVAQKNGQPKGRFLGHLRSISSPFLSPSGFIWPDLHLRKFKPFYSLMCILVHEGAVYTDVAFPVQRLSSEALRSAQGCHRRLFAQPRYIGAAASD